MPALVSRLCRSSLASWEQGAGAGGGLDSFVSRGEQEIRRRRGEQRAKALTWSYILGKTQLPKKCYQMSIKDSSTAAIWSVESQGDVARSRSLEAKLACLDLEQESSLAQVVRLLLELRDCGARKVTEGPAEIGDCISREAPCLPGYPTYSTQQFTGPPCTLRPLLLPALKLPALLGLEEEREDEGYNSPPPVREDEEEDIWEAALAGPGASVRRSWATLGQAAAPR